MLASDSRSRATLIGFSAVVMWAMLALLTAGSGTMPPFQLAAMTFAIGTVAGLVIFGALGRLPAIPRGQRAAMLTGIAGLFLYHALYFTALRNAPAVEASLIAYLWPLLIVVGSALLPGERLRAHHVLGAVIGLGGAALILVSRGGGLSGGGNALGYGAALACAFTWSAYSLLSRRFSAIPTDAVVLQCAVTAILSLLCHLAFETTVWPDGVSQWLAIIGLGLLPVGAAFYAWDHGCKAGDIQILGATSYASPLLSTLILIVAGMAEATPAVLGACLLITLGAVIASKDLIWKGKPQ
ncbi:MAG: EamA family transporter [Rhizobiaceae bacterium]|jgi:drug/metabolite transporter (DMT)-like permease|nr:EamA family transporter [Rhizobiaceae bacterium]